MYRTASLTTLVVLLVATLIGLAPHRAPVQAADPQADFKAQVVGFVQKHCINCHNEKTKRADLSLSGYTDAASIVKDRRVWQNVFDQVHQGVMPPPTKPRPAQAELDAFLGGIGHAFAEADRNAKPDPGRVTVRRLNRAEYNNTVRDLCGVDFNPAEDFPSDDVGHGFDNIGDVLSLSPILLERYLAAAEVILQRAITIDPPKPPRRQISIQYTEPAGPKVPLRGGYRFLTSAAGASPMESGPVHTPYQVPSDGEYTFRSRVYVEREGNEPVKVVVLAHGTDISKPATKEEADRIVGTPPAPFMILKTLEIKGRDEKSAENISVEIPANIGLKRTAIGLLKPTDGKPVKLYVQYLALDGPKDTRPASHRMLLKCNPEAPPREQAREILSRFASRAYRRPATLDEVERLLKLFDSSQKAGEKFEAGIVLAMQAVLVSPKFLFRVELDDRPDSTEPHPITEWQLASRLSYFIWSSMPDEELLDLARKGELTKNLDTQVARMLKSPKATALVDNFAMQWLQLRTLKSLAPDGTLFPKFDEQLKAAMLTETELFLKEIVREDRSILDLIDGKFTYLNGRLANHYTIADTQGNRWGQKPVKRGEKIPWDKFVRVELPDDERSGILTMGSVLTVTSNPTRTSPVKRGRWVLEQIMGTPPPPAPPNVPELDAQKQTSGTLRQRMEQHRENPSCAGCHARMDPLGFAFENFDAVGAWRTVDGKDPIDSSGVLPNGKKFKGPSELKAILKENRDQFTRCLTEKMLTFALGRGLEFYDRRAVDAIVAQVAKKDYKVSALVSAIAASDPFRMRRGKGTNP
jgi:hypothetical protein